MSHPSRKWDKVCTVCNCRRKITRNSMGTGTMCLFWHVWGFISQFRCCFCYKVKSIRVHRVMENLNDRFPGLEKSWKSFKMSRVMETSWKMEIYHNKITFWPNIKCDIPSNILMHSRGAISVRKVGYLKGHGISIFYHGKVMEFKEEHEHWFIFCRLWWICLHMVLTT